MTEDYLLPTDYKTDIISSQMSFTDGNLISFLVIRIINQKKNVKPHTDSECLQIKSAILKSPDYRKLEKNHIKNILTEVLMGLSI